MTETTAPLGRADEFDDIWRWISSAPSVVLISGAAGSGVTTLVAAVAEKARLEGIFGGSLPNGIAEYDGPAYLRSRLDPEGHLPFQGGANVIEYASRFVDRLRRAPEGKQVPTERLYVVDGYRPSPEIDDWFSAMAGALAAGERRGSALLVTGAEDRLTALSQAASQTLGLGPLDTDEVRATLVEAGASLVPTLLPDELDSYVSTASKQPAVLEDLLTLFEFVGLASP